MNRDYGVDIRVNRPEIINIRPSFNMTRDFQDAYDRVSQSCRSNCQLLVVILSARNSSQVYGEVKR